MFFGALILGTLAGISAGLITVLGLGASLWLGLFAWWLVGTVVMLAPLVVSVYFSSEQIAPKGAATA
jgi:hypothetical protein